METTATPIKRPRQPKIAHPPTFFRSTISELAGTGITLKEQYDLIDLFHQDHNMIVHDTTTKIRLINQLAFLCKHARDTLNDFARGRLHAFDPLAGDAGCQLRAYIAIQLYKQKEILFDFDYLDCFWHSLELHCTEIASWLANAASPKTRMSLTTFLTHHGLKRSISLPMFYLLLARLLTIYNPINEHGLAPSLGLEQIASALCESKKYVERLCRYYQQQLSRLTCFYITQLAAYLKDSRLLNTVTLLIRTDESNRDIFPCYLGMHIILAHALRDKVDILLDITMLNDTSCQQKFQILFTPQKNLFALRTDIRSYTPATPAIVISLSTSSTFSTTPDQKRARNNFLSQLSTMDIRRIILAFMARHPQYVGKKLAPYRYDPWLGLQKTPSTLHKQFLKHRDESNHLNCNMGNPNFFFARHCFATTLQYFATSPAKIGFLPSPIHHPQQNFHYWISPTESLLNLWAEPIYLSWVDRSTEKLKIILGTGIEHCLWGYLNSDDISKVVSFLFAQKQQWMTQNKSYLHSLPIEHSITHFEEFFTYEDFQQYQSLIAAKQNPQLQIHLSSEAKKMQSEWQKIRITHNLPDISEAAWQRHIINLAAVAALWQTKKIFINCCNFKISGLTELLSSVSLSAISKQFVTEACAAA